VIVAELPRDVQFDLAVRLVGTVQDFEGLTLLQVALSGPDLSEVEGGFLDVPIEPRAPAPTHLPGYEINHTLGLRVDFPAFAYGGYDLSFALDGQPQHRQKTTISVVRPA
jgi:hypothetical protein